MSARSGHRLLFLRKTSRTRRFTRFRSTARLMCFLGVLIPRRVHVTSGPTALFGLHCTRTTFPLKFRPNRPTRLKSACDLMRSRGRNTSPSIGSTARFLLFSFALRRPSAHDARCASARSFGSIVGRDARQDATNASYESSSTASSKTSSASARLPSSGSDAPSAGDADAEVALARRWLDAQDATRERAAASPRRRCDARTAETLRA
mmetsp:Transcript_14168/g.59681  ORF Transcript_14168/g.59681 Transcript_14168/m.59681 type:complete len:207 (-) Transcript_14168:247-867(-)